ncbi:uncharacterized protein RCO7_14218 [Rhynchosporium graminicola]|uniref:Uncharacterized protein n=1 Tax=Rhynchosporium graminicola TaxID=2792576 RepID=A0A1E1K0E6_9HELO|nr:uncharacterized protein RCO7_14218 [Rhynchosporium commune]
MSMRLKVEDRIWKAPSRYLGNLQFGSVILYPICRTGRIMARSTLDFKEIDKHIGTHSRMNLSSNSLFGKLHEQWNFWKIWNNRGHLIPTTQTRRRLHNRLPTTEFSSLYDIGAVLPLPLDRRRVVRKSWLVFVDVQAHKRATLRTNWGPPGKCNSQFHIPDCLERALKLTGGCPTSSVSWNGSWGRVICHAVFRTFCYQRTLYLHTSASVLDDAIQPGLHLLALDIFSLRARASHTRRY